VRLGQRLTDWGGFDRIVDWFAVKANDYCLWVHERELRYARNHNPKCPDCGEHHPFCYCDDRERERDIADGAFDAGMERGYEVAQNDWRRGAEW
jgi:hypothetical protein